MDPTSLKKQRVATISNSAIDSTDSSTGSPQSQPINNSKTAETNAILAPYDYKGKGIATDINGGWGWGCIKCGSNQLRRLPPCEHCICDECIMPLITGMIKSGVLGFKCPKKKCNVMWTVDQCVDYLPREVVGRLIDVIREASVLANPQYSTCPSPKCGVLWIDDVIRARDPVRVCTTCWGTFCTRCRIDWHAGMSCARYQVLVRAADQWFS